MERISLVPFLRFFVVILCIVGLLLPEINSPKWKELTRAIKDIEDREN